MGYPTVRFDSNVVTRAPSQRVWRNSLDRYADCTENLGSLFCEDFVEKLYANITDGSQQNGWFLQDMAAGGTGEAMLTTDSPDGEVTISASTGTAHFGIEVHRGANASSAGTVNLSTHATDARGAMIFETRVNTTAATVLYVGLTEAIVQFLSATSTLPTNSNYIGFYKAANGDLRFVCDEDDAGAASDVTVVAAADVTDGYHKLAYRVNADKSVQIFFDEAEIVRDTSGATINIPVANIPDKSLTQKYCIGRGAGASATVALPVDWVRCLVEN